MLICYTLQLMTDRSTKPYHDFTCSGRYHPHARKALSQCEGYSILSQEKTMNAIHNDLWLWEIDPLKRLNRIMFEFLHANHRMIPRKHSKYIYIYI